MIQVKGQPMLLRIALAMITAPLNCQKQFVAIGGKAEPFMLSVVGKILKAGNREAADPLMKQRRQSYRIKLLADNRTVLEAIEEIELALVQKQRCFIAVFDAKQATRNDPAPSCCIGSCDLQRVRRSNI